MYREHGEDEDDLDMEEAIMDTDCQLFLTDWSV